MNIIFFISLCDFIGSIVNIFGFPESTTILCSVQGFLFVYFFPASWCFTTMMVYQLRCLLIDKKIWLSVYWVHAICWSAAALIALLPLSELDYGSDDEYSGHSPCTLCGRLFWMEVFYVGCFYGFLFFNFLLMIYWSSQVGWHFRKEGITEIHRMYALYKSTRFYPFAMLFTWLPIFIMVCLFTYNSESNNGDIVPLTLIEICQYIATQNGTAMCYVFFANSPDAREYWKSLFCHRNESIDSSYSSYNGEEIGGPPFTDNPIIPSNKKRVDSFDIETEDENDSSGSRSKF
jgi:hypothetical protein